MNEFSIRRLARPLAGLCLAFTLSAELKAQELKTDSADITAAALKKSAVKNFGRVNDQLFRGAQPRVIDYKELAEMGIKTILDLRDDAEKFAADGAEKAGLKYINIRLNAKRPPTRKESEEFLRIVREEANGPVYVHCAGGRHRTGVLVAVYRMEIDGWDAQKAFDEMLNYDFYSAWGHGKMKTFVFDYYKALKDRQLNAAKTSEQSQEN